MNEENRLNRAMATIAEPEFREDYLKKAQSFEKMNCSRTT